MKDRFHTLLLIALSMALGWSLSSRPAYADIYSSDIRDLTKEVKQMADDLHRWVDADLRAKRYQ